ncbi:hypothetical protein HN011_001301 [Eciton burchellii]|nr:hypothetical protein HN011_001301 [Eciton burchellii]
MPLAISRALVRDGRSSVVPLPGHPGSFESAGGVFVDGPRDDEMIWPDALSLLHGTERGIPGSPSTFARFASCHDSWPPSPRLDGTESLRDLDDDDGDSTTRRPDPADRITADRALDRRSLRRQPFACPG